MLVFGTFSLFAQDDFKNEADLKKGADELFEQKKYVVATQPFSQLISLYPKDPNYAYKYGACLIYSSENPDEPLTYLKFAASQADVDPVAHFFLGQAYHINFKFKDAIESYEKFKSKAKGKTLKEFDADGMIRMCNNGQTLLKTITDVVVYEKNPSTALDFFRAYNLEGYGGKLIVKPEEFMTDYEKKNNIQSVMFLPDNAERLYFSSFDGKSETGRDLYLVDKTEDGWGNPFKLSTTLNTNYDDDFPFIHPNGKVLYFSSKGHNSMGGYDIFRSFYDEALGKWKAPVNLDFAVNTPYDDFFMVTNQEQDRAYFASNRYSKAPSVNVYNIAMQRLPVDFSLVKGNFVSPNSKTAAITVEDMYSNETVGTFQTDENGNYNIKLPSSGKFRFLVEEENSLITHAGVVEMPKREDFKPLLQKMEIVKEGESEKLIITNLLDEEIGEEELPLPVELIVEQANLKVNFEDKGPQLITQAKAEKQGPQLVLSEPIVSNSSNSASSENPVIEEPSGAANSIAEMDLPELLNAAAQMEKQLAEDASSFQKQADLAKATNQKFTDLAANERAQIAQLEEGPKADDPEIIAEIDNLSKDAEEHEFTASASEQLASNYETKASQRRERAKVAKDQKESIGSAIKDEQTAEELEYLGEIKSSLEAVDIDYQESIENSGNQIVYNDLLKDYQKQEKSIEEQNNYISDLSGALTTDKAKLNELKSELEGTTKKKKVKELDQEIANLELTISSSESEIETSQVAIAESQLQKEKIKYQLKSAPEYDALVNPTKTEEERNQEFAASINATEFPPEKAVELGAIKSMSALAQANNNLKSKGTSQAAGGDAVNSTNNQSSGESGQAIASTASSENSESNQLSEANQSGEIGQFNEPTGEGQSSKSINSTNQTNNSLETSSLAVSDNTTQSDPNQKANSSNNTSTPNLSNVEVPQGLLSEEYANYNFEANYNEEFFLPVPNGAELPLTASTDNKPYVEEKLPEPIDVGTLPTEVEFSGEYLSLLTEADTIQDDIKRESTKAELLDTWSYKLDTEIFFLKKKRREASSEDKKQKLTTKIDALEAQQQQIVGAADQSYERLSIQQNGLIGEQALSTPTMKKQLEYQNLSNVLKSTYNADYSEQFNDLAEVEDDFLRLYKTREINEKWIEDLNKETADLEKIAAVEPNPNKKAIIEQRLTSLNQLKSRKINELSQTNQRVMQYAFNNPTDNVPKVNSGMTKARAKSLAADAQNLLVSSISLSDSASKVSDPEIRNQLITQANQDYEQSIQVANQAASIYASLGKYSTSASNSVKFDSESDYQTADVNQLIVDLENQKENPTNNSQSNQSAGDKFKVSLNAMSGEPISLANAKFEVQSKQKELEIATTSVAILQAAYDSETDETKKQEIFSALSLAKTERKIVEAQVSAQNNKLSLLESAQKNALSNPKANEENIQKSLAQAETLNQLGTDSVAIAQEIRKEAESLTGEEKQRKLLEASTVEKRANANLEASKELVQLAEAIKRTEKSAIVKNELPNAVSSFNFPTTDKILTEAEVSDLLSKEEYSQFENLKKDYQRAIKEAEVMYSGSEKKRVEAKADFQQANNLREDAATAADLAERKRLIQEAEVLEKSAKAKVKEAEQMESAANELANNAIGKKKELEEYVANLNPAIAAMIVANENKPKGKGGSFGGVLANNNSNASNQSASNKTNQPGNVNVVIPQSVKASQFYAGDDLKNLEVKYDPQTKSIFKIGDANTAYYNEAQPIEFNPDLPSGLVYKVQIGAFTKRINPGSFRGFAPITAENAGNNLIRYTAGMFEGFSPADLAKNEIRKIGYPDAFVVAYYNGKRVSAADANDMVNLAGAQIAALSGVSPANSNGNSNTSSVSKAKPVSNSNIPPTAPKTNSVAQVEVNSPSTQITDNTNLDGTYYTVQIGVFRKMVTAADLKNVSPIAVFKTDNGYFRYNSGVFENIQEAIDAKNKIVSAGISDAFVTAYSNKNRVNPETAKKEIKSSGTNLSQSNEQSQTQTQRQQPNVSPAKQQAPRASTASNSKPPKEKILFRVQVGAYSKDIPVEQAKVILGLTSYGVDIDESEVNLTKYLVGNFINYEEANNFKNDMVIKGLGDAFVVALQNGKRIETQKARELINQK